MTRFNTLVLVLFACTLLLTLAPGPVAASTPDGETPAEEDVCDSQSGAAYGLCNAFCEAMDCHLAYDGDDLTSPAASAAACSKVENRFVQLSGEHHVPCHGVVCPTGTEGCPCTKEFTCSGELYCGEDALCEFGGDEF